MVPERVVVTGLGVVAPNAHGKEAFSHALREGKSGIRFFQDLRDGGLACQVGGVPEGIDELSARYFTEEERLVENHTTALAAIAAIDAWTDAGLVRSPADSDEVDWDSGAIIGTGCGALEVVAEKIVPFVNAGKVRRLGSTMEQAFISSNSARVAGVLGLGNRVSTNSSACATGTEAIVDSFLRIREGRAVRMLAGGSEGSHSKYAWAGADAMHETCRTHNDAPEKASRPMSASAGGCVPAAGAGVLLLESLSSAQARRAPIYAEVLGGNVNCGALRMGRAKSMANPEGVRRCIRAAVAMAGIRSEEIDAINGHLAATPDADPLEVESWSVALGLQPSQMPLIQATKSMIGHTLGAAGGIECVASILELCEGFVHGSINCEDLHPALAAYSKRIPHTTVLLPRMKVLAKGSFGYGDVNACIVFRKFEN
jgi:3-oxoacyl-(acyl-carrier-protein) synthase